MPLPKHRQPSKNNAIENVAPEFFAGLTVGINKARLLISLSVTGESRGADVTMLAKCRPSARNVELSCPP